MTELKCCVSGHTAEQIRWLWRRIGNTYLTMKTYLKLLVTELVEKGYTHFVTGLSIGSETLFAEILLFLKKEYPQIKLECTLPCKNFVKYLKCNERKWYDRILTNADVINNCKVLLSLSSPFARMNKMIDECDLLLALWEGEIWQSVAYAQEKSKEVLHIHLTEKGFLKSY